MYFWQMCIKSDWMESELSGDFLNYPDSLWIIQTVSGLSRQFLYQPGSLWNVRTVFRLSGKSLDCRDSSYAFVHVFIHISPDKSKEDGMGVLRRRMRGKSRQLC